MRRSVFILAVTFLCAGFIYFDFPFLNPKPAELRFDHRAEVRSGEKTCEFQVALANTMLSRAQGLMHQASLEPTQGMLFDFGKDAPVSMWMKDTPLSLDMLFIDHQGVVKHIVRRAVPGSTDPIPSVYPVRAVLEVPAGMAETCAMTPGSTVIHSMFEHP